MFIRAKLQRVLKTVVLVRVLRAPKLRSMLFTGCMVDPPCGCAWA